jgi:hypothetical protein
MAKVLVTLYVQAPKGNGYTTPRAMKRVDDHLRQDASANMKCPPPSGMPVQEEDGTWEVRIYNANLAEYVKYILKNHYGLEIVREVKHD